MVLPSFAEIIRYSLHTEDANVKHFFTSVSSFLHCPVMSFLHRKKSTAITCSALAVIIFSFAAALHFSGRAYTLYLYGSDAAYPDASGHQYFALSNPVYCMLPRR